MRRRYEKSFFHSGLAIIRSRYLDVFHRHAKAAVPLTELTRTLRSAVPQAGVVRERIPENAVIYGAFNTRICEPVTAETLAQRRTIAKHLTQQGYFNPPKTHLSFWKTMRAKRLAGLFAPILREEPVYNINGMS